MYEGEYHLGKKEGKGKLSWADGSMYNGEFKNNNIEGIGCVTCNTLQEFMNGVMAEDTKVSGEVIR